MITRKHKCEIAHFLWESTQVVWIWSWNSYYLGSYWSWLPSSSLAVRRWRIFLRNLVFPS